MTAKQTKRISKFLSLILRHQPQKINLTLDEYGWTKVDELIQKSNDFGVKFSREELDEVVATNNKKRFSFNEDGTQIRANQGHSIKINLGYKAVEPPKTLFHGTATRFLEDIKKEGLKKMKRHHVHLSADQVTATSVGKRHGKLALLTIQSKAMHDAGYEFFVSENGVWLTDSVPVEFIVF